MPDQGDEFQNKRDNLNGKNKDPQSTFKHQEEKIDKLKQTIQLAMTPINQAMRRAVRGLWNRAARDTEANRYDPKFWRDCLNISIDLAEKEGRDVEIPVRAARALQCILSDKPPKKSRQTTDDFAARELAVLEVEQLRAAGMTREEAIGHVASENDLPEATIKTWIERYRSPENSST